MGISSYLHNKATEAVIRDTEKESIKKSIKAIKERIDNYFDDVEGHFIFGSYTRNTILPREIDERSDIDYMVVFEDNDYTPQTYLNKLRKFVEKYYAKSEIKQSHPAIQLELNHITFELVPALDKVSFFENHISYQIPSKSDDIDEWIDTNPNDFNKELTEANQNNNSLIKPLIRLLKYWNAKNNYVFESFLLEKDIVATSGFWFTGGKKLKDYFYQYIKSMDSDNFEAQWKRDKIHEIQERVENAIEKESEEPHQEAENIIRKIFKDKVVSFSENSLALPYVKKPKWDMVNYYTAQINATVDGSKFNSGDLLEKHCSLIFHVITQAEAPFDVYWQVVNTGEEARMAGCLRGDIYQAKTAGRGGLNWKERTLYAGTHWVECFIVKGNQCVARSNGFTIRIQ
ncbi:MAG: hypothetical protein Ctma_0177 [Catillopecten margaritatus gill symbiont]|uniref:Adenylyl/Guanylyl and SMODS C-terminal sensor domain-containing protein n=1 Tax=Catillopecten margaritatus gill symbiont TaxID=3083288 RepID=A0AAU6PES4_9GAMM